MTTRTWYRSLILLAVLGTTGLAVPHAQTPAARRVEIGWCVGIARLELAKSVGFDYAELNTTEVATLSDADFEALLVRHKQIGLPTPVSNVFIPRDRSIVVVGRDADVDKQMAYVKKAFDRMARLGVRMVVFGGGKDVPEGWTEEAAFKQLVDFDRRIAPEARMRGITVVIEPTSEGNFIKTVGEGLRLAEASADPNIQVMADFYHVAKANEDPAIVLKARDRLRHVHIANPNGRVFPVQWEEYDYTKFFANLRQIGYSGRISVEGGSKDVPAEAPKTIALLRRAMAPQ